MSDRHADATMHPADESPKLMYCHRCVGDELAYWENDRWVCGSCGRTK